MESHKFLVHLFIVPPTSTLNLKSLEKISFFLIATISICCSDSTEFVLDDVGIDEISKINVLPVFSYQMGIEDIFHPVDLEFQLGGTEVVTFKYSTDTTVKVIGQSIRLENPTSETTSINLNTALLKYGNVSLDRVGLFENQVFPELVDMSSPTVPDTLAVPDATYLPGIALSNFSINIDAELNQFDLLKGEFVVSGYNGFQADLKIDYEIVSDGLVIDEKSINVLASSSFTSTHLVDALNLSELSLTSGAELRVVALSFYNGFIGQGDLIMNASIGSGWEAQLTFDTEVEFDFDSVFVFPLTLNEIGGGGNSEIYEFVLGESLITYVPQTSPISSPANLEFRLRDSEFVDLPYNIQVRANAVTNRRAPFQQVRIGNATNNQNLVHIIFDGTLRLSAGETLTYDSQSPILASEMSMTRLDDDLVSFRGNLADDFELPLLIDALRMSIFDNTLALSDALILPDMQLVLSFQNDYNVGLVLNLEELTLLDQDGSEIDSVFPTTELERVLINPQETAQKTIPLASLQEILLSKPSEIAFSFQPELLDGNGEESFLATDLIRLDIDFEIPMNIDGSGLVLVDTVANTFDWSELISAFDEPVLRFAHKNHFPFDFMGEIWLLDENNNTELLFDDLVMESSPDSTMLRDDLKLSNEQLEKIINAKAWIFDLTYESNSLETDDFVINATDLLFVECQILQDEI